MIESSLKEGQAHVIFYQNTCLYLSEGKMSELLRYKDLLLEIENLKSRMEEKIRENFNTRKSYSSFKYFSAIYNVLIQNYSDLTADRSLVPFTYVSYPSDIPVSWEFDKFNFENLYSQVGILLGRTKNRASHVSFDFEGLLHPLIREKAGATFVAGDHRSAVLNSIIAVFDKIRDRTSRTDDGEVLVNNVFSIHKPLLVLTDIETERGRAEQLGFMEILKGVYKGVRNPRSHSLEGGGIDESKAAQYLIMMSLLMRLVLDARFDDASRK